MSRKPSILAFNLFYLPGYRAGGPIRTLANMVERLSDDFAFRIVTQDRDAGEREPYLGIARDTWNPVGRAQVMYLDPAGVSVRRLVDLVAATAPDAIYLNSFFDPIFTQRILLARRLGRLGKTPVVLAPRGEFSAGALQLKQTRKNVYLRLSSLAGLYRGLTWQASSDLERADIQRHLRFVRTADIRIAMDLAPLEEPAVGAWSPRPDGEPLRVCFLSRISPMKNLDFALRALAAVRAPVVFTVHGPKEVPAYWAECERLIACLPPNVRVVYGGSVHPDAVKRTMAQHDLFFLPTRGENYGHVIHEALHAGLPVLISDQTPWGAVDERGAGWAFPLDNVADFARTIDEVATWDRERLAATRARATDYAREKAVSAEVLQANRAVFAAAVHGGGG